MFTRLLYHPEIIKKIIILDGTFNDLEYDFYYEKLLEWYKTEKQKGGKLFFESFLETLGKKERVVLTELYEKNKNKSETIDVNPAFTNDCLKKFQVEAINLKISELKKKIQNNTDNVLLLAKLVKLVKKRNKIMGSTYS